MYKSRQHFTSLIPHTETLKPIFKLNVVFMQIDETAIHKGVVTPQTQPESDLVTMSNSDIICNHLWVFYKYKCSLLDFSE